MLSFALSRLRTRLWWRSEIKINTKVRNYQVLIRTIFLYSCKVWSVRDGDLHKLEVFDQFCLRRIVRDRWQHFISITAVDTRCKIGSLQHDLNARWLRWFGHTIRRHSSGFNREVIALDQHHKRVLRRIKRTSNHSWAPVRTRDSPSKSYLVNSYWLNCSFRSRCGKFVWRSQLKRPRLNTAATSIHLVRKKHRLRSKYIF